MDQRDDDGSSQPKEKRKIVISNDLERTGPLKAEKSRGNDLLSSVGNNNDQIKILESRDLSNNSPASNLEIENLEINKSS